MLQKILRLFCPFSFLLLFWLESQVAFCNVRKKIKLYNWLNFCASIISCLKKVKMSSAAFRVIFFVCFVSSSALELDENCLKSAMATLCQKFRPDWTECTEKAYPPIYNKVSKLFKPNYIFKFLDDRVTTKNNYSLLKIVSICSRSRSTFAWARETKCVSKWGTFASTTVSWQFTCPIFHT